MSEKRTPDSKINLSDSHPTIRPDVRTSPNSGAGDLENPNLCPISDFGTEGSGRDAPIEPTGETRSATERAGRPERSSRSDQPNSTNPPSVAAQARQRASARTDATANARAENQIKSTLYGAISAPFSPPMMRFKGLKMLTKSEGIY